MKRNLAIVTLAFTITTFCAIQNTHMKTALGLTIADGNIVTLSCNKMGGNVDLGIRQEGEDFIFTIQYPKVIRTYLGGHNNKTGITAFSPAVRFYIDVDNNAKTGLQYEHLPEAMGSEYSVGLGPMGTSVVDKRTGKWVTKEVLIIDITEKMFEKLKSGDGTSPKIEIDNKGHFEEVDWAYLIDSTTLRTRIPISVFHLKKGAQIRVSALVGMCRDNPVSYQSKLWKEMTFALN